MLLFKRKVFWIVVTLIIILSLLWQTAIVEIIIYTTFSASEDKGAIALSFDDGPDWGEEILISELNEAGMKVTFFWIYEKIELLKNEDSDRFDKLLRLLKEGGHEVGIHGYECRGSQNPITRFLFANELENLLNLKQKFHSILDKEPVLFRSHGPRSGRQFYNQLRESNLHLIFGSLTYQISITASEDIFIDHFTEATSGTIICAHDSRNCDPDYGLAVEIANIVPELVKIMHDRNIEVVTVSELLD